MTVYCQHIQNFGKEGQAISIYRGFSRIYWVLKSPVLRCTDGPVSCEAIPQWHFHFWSVISPHETLDLRWEKFSLWHFSWQRIGSLALVAVVTFLLHKSRQMLFTECFNKWIHLKVLFGTIKATDCWWTGEKKN